MGTSSLIDDESETDLDDLSMTDVFNEQLPYYLSIGMTSDEYWRGDNTLPRYYRKAQELREKRFNNHAYISGQYTLAAVAAGMNSKNKYPAEPFPLTQDEVEQRKQRDFRKKVDLWKRDAKNV